MTLTWSTPHISCSRTPASHCLCCRAPQANARPPIRRCLKLCARQSHFDRAGGFIKITSHISGLPALLYSQFTATAGVLTARAHGPAAPVRGPHQNHSVPVVPRRFSRMRPCFCPFCTSGHRHLSRTASRAPMPSPRGDKRQIYKTALRCSSSTTSLPSQPHQPPPPDYSYHNAILQIYPPRRCGLRRHPRRRVACHLPVARVRPGVHLRL